MNNAGLNPFNPALVNGSPLTNYNDLNALQSLKAQSKSDQAGALDSVAKQFESLFVSMMIKSMRDANKVFSEGNPLQSSESEFYQQMFDSQVAVSLSTSKGIGLAEVIKRQLAKSLPHEPQSAVSPNPAERALELTKNYSVEDYPRTLFNAPVSVQKVQETVAKIDQTLQHLPPVTAPEIVSEPVTVVDFSSPDKFIESLYPLAKKVEQQTGIDARLMLAQSALETGWGQHQIVQPDGRPSFNLFGIKAQLGWLGERAESVTTEYRHGVAIKERASFRAYASYDESFQDYARFLQSNTRYQDALQHSANPKAFAYALQDSGYATDPEYGTKISRIMDRYLSDEVDGLADLGQGSTNGSGTP